MFVAASTSCFPDLPFETVIEKLCDLEFTAVELEIRDGGHIEPSTVVENMNRAVEICNSTRRLDIASYLVDLSTEGEEYFEQFEACCRLAKATRVVTLVVPSAELGTPFNEEVEKLKRLVEIATKQGVRVGMKSEQGRLSGDPDTVQVICDHINSLGLAYDPSHYIYKCDPNLDDDKIIKYAHHVYLRDTSRDELQVRVGQGTVDYGKLVNILSKMKYNRALCVQIEPKDGIDHAAELRKIRLLLESLLI